jgi:halocyanin-like protein
MSEAISRRGFVRGAAGATALGVGASGTAAAQSEKPDFGGYISDANGGEFEDLRGESEVTVTVGGGSQGLAFLPTNLWIDTGTKVTFEWTGSQSHNVLYEEKPDGADISGHEGLESGDFTFSETFDTAGLYKYFCQPHKSLGMLGGIAVGGDVPTASAGGGGGESGGSGGGGSRPKVPDTAKTIGVATFIAMIATLGLAFFFLKYGGDYGAPE